MPLIAVCTLWRSAISPLTISIRSWGLGTRLWHRTRMMISSSAEERKMRRIKWEPTLPVAPVTKMCFICFNDGGDLLLRFAEGGALISPDFANPAFPASEQILAVRCRGRFTIRLSCSRKRKITLLLDRLFVQHR